MGVARSSLYAWRSRPGTVTTQARREALKIESVQVFNHRRAAAGCRRITAELNGEGFTCSVGVVADLMRELGLVAIQKRAYRRTTVIDEQAQVFTDRFERDFAPEPNTPGQVLAGDITYLRTGQGRLYLTTVIDPARARFIGWQIADHMRASLVTDAPAMAHVQHRAQAGAVFHSEHGSQFRPRESQQTLKRLGLVGSMGLVGAAGGQCGAGIVLRRLAEERRPRSLPLADAGSVAHSDRALGRADLSPEAPTATFG